MKLLLLLPLLLGFTSPLFADSTDGYVEKVTAQNKSGNKYFYLMRKKENHDKWGVWRKETNTNNWVDKAVGIDTACKTFKSKIDSTSNMKDNYISDFQTWCPSSTW